ncbi:Lymphocyte antigen [Dirofilaria immitis]
MDGHFMSDYWTNCTMVLLASVLKLEIEKQCWICCRKSNMIFSGLCDSLRFYVGLNFFFICKLFVGVCMDVLRIQGLS